MDDGRCVMVMCMLCACLPQSKTIFILISDQSKQNPSRQNHNGHSAGRSAPLRSRNGLLVLPPALSQKHNHNQLYTGNSSPVCSSVRTSTAADTVNDLTHSHEVKYCCYTQPKKQSDIQYTVKIFKYFITLY